MNPLECSMRFCSTTVVGITTHSRHSRNSEHHKSTDFEAGSQPLWSLPPGPRLKSTQSAVVARGRARRYLQELPQSKSSTTDRATPPLVLHGLQFRVSRTDMRVIALARARPGRSYRTTPSSHPLSQIHTRASLACQRNLGAGFHPGPSDADCTRVVSRAPGRPILRGSTKLRGGMTKLLYLDRTDTPGPRDERLCPELIWPGSSRLPGATNCPPYLYSTSPSGTDPRAIAPPLGD